jgi:hypothetical protein
MEGADPWEFFQVPQCSWNVKEEDSVWLTEVDYILIRFTLHASHYLIFNSNLSYFHAMLVLSSLY